MHIDSYQFGEVVIDGVRYTSDCIILGGDVQADWWRKQGHSLSGCVAIASWNIYYLCHLSKIIKSVCCQATSSLFHKLRTKYRLLLYDTAISMLFIIRQA